MQNLDEKIDSLLYGSLLKEYQTLDEAKGQDRRSLDDRARQRRVVPEAATKQDKGHVKVKKIYAGTLHAEKLAKYLSIDGKSHGLNEEVFIYLIQLFVQDHQDKAREKGIELIFGDVPKKEKTKNQPELAEEEEQDESVGLDLAIIALGNRILNDLIVRSKNNPVGKSNKLAGLKNYVYPLTKSGAAYILDEVDRAYNLKKLVWAAQQLGFYKEYDIGDFDPRPKSPDEQPQTEPEKTPETEPEKAPEAGEQKPEEPKQELSPQDQKEVQDYMNKSIHLLAIQTILDGEYQPPANYGRLIRKYFIEKEVRRKGTLAEDLFEEEEEEKPKQTPKTSNTDDEEQKDDLRMVRQALYEKRPPTPEEAKASYDSLLKAYKLTTDNPGKEMMGRVSKKLSYGGPDRITPQGGLPSDFASRLNRIKFLIYRGAGVEVEEAQKMSKTNPFRSSLKEDAVRTPVLNLNDFKGNSLNEGMLGMFGAWIEYALKGMFGGWGSNLKVLGSKRDVEAFAKTLSGEARYIQAAKKYGLDHPTTYRNKSSLEVAVKNFEKETGIQWPFR